jgi:hypothetical protein
MSKKAIKNYVYTFDKADDYIYSDIFDSKEKAIEQAKKEWENDKKTQKLYPDKKLYICEYEIYKENTSLVREVVELIQENADFYPEYMDLLEEHKNILDKMLNNTVLRFQKKYGYEPDFWNTLKEKEEIIYLDI